MKNTLLLLMFLFLTHKLQSQGDGGISSLIVLLSQRSTVLYSDTVFEFEQLQFKVNETYAFRNKIKTTMLITNLSDSYKTLYSEDITITDSENNSIVINQKKPMVIPPKSAKKFGILAESKSFKLYNIKISIKEIHSTGNAISILTPNLFNLHSEGTSTGKIGALEITRTKCNSSPDGIVKVYFKLIYTGNNFLAIQGSNAKLLSDNKKVYMNLSRKSQATFYPKNKEAYTMLLEFANLQPNFIGDNCDKISFENVFKEYEIYSNNKPFEFQIHKKGLVEGESPKEEKEKED